jgi:hypothetical protein
MSKKRDIPNLGKQPPRTKKGLPPAQPGKPAPKPQTTGSQQVRLPSGNRRGG